MELYYKMQALTGRGSPRFYRGSKNMIGHGWGNILGSLIKTAAKSARPLLKKSGKYLIKEGLKTASQIGNDIIEGESFKSAAKSRSTELNNRVKKKLKRKVSSALQNSASLRGKNKKSKLTKKIKISKQSTR